MRTPLFPALLSGTALVLQACRIPESPVQGIETPTATSELAAPPGFGFSMMQARTFVVRVETPSGEPYPDALVHLLSADGSPIETLPTDAGGVATFRAAAPEGRVRVHVTAVGIPNDTLVLTTDDPSASLPADLSADLPVVQAQAAAPAGFAGRGLAWSLPSTNASGLPAGLDVTRRSEITSAFLSDVNFAFPEQSRVPERHPEYIQTGNAEEIELSDSAEMHVTFLHEGAGYRNSFGYYVVPPSGAASSAKTLDKRIAFPNASLQGSGGALVAGDRIRLGAFPAGTRIGFFVIADGWNGSRVDTSGKPTYYSRSALNPEPTEAARRHLAMLFHESTGRVVLGFEDLNRNSSGCDHDFNDVLFTVSWNPFRAVPADQFVVLPGRTDTDRDGVSDNVDAYPDDATRAFDRHYPSATGWGTAAFEDLWPSQGDFDFNDAVVKYRVRETRNAKMQVRDLELTAVPVAAGADLHSGLAVGLGRIAAAPESARVLAGGRTMASPLLRDGTGETVLRLSRDVLGLFRGGTGRMANTLPGGPRLEADTVRARLVFATPVLLPDPPYDLFLHRTADSTHEIHLPDRAGSGKAKRSLFRTCDDKTDSVKGIWYRGPGNLPWALNMPGEWRHPREGVDILRAYPAFATWIGSAGRSDLDWYLKPASTSFLAP